jgi:dephospho-CoA kinase
MLILRKIAITGGLSAGKSSVAGFFKDLGAYLLDTDVIVHNLLESPFIQKQVVDLLGPQIIENNTLNRTEIAKLVFKDPKKLELLEQILHPLVRDEVERKYKQACKEKNWNLFVVEIPLLFETNSQSYYDKTIAVIADEPSCQKRFMSKTNQNVHSFKERANRQLPQEEKAKKANFTLYNNGSLADLKRAFLKIYPQIIQ